MPKYIPQLDGLRAVAVGAVLITHLAPNAPAGNSWGYYGVRLFFVLSGFLITGILLRCRADEKSLPPRLARHYRWHSVRQFYVRRVLRIFPVFYLSIVIAAALDLPSVRATFLWDISYLTNYRAVIFGKTHGAVDHLWSLSVEEQFYLLWPWLVLWAPERWMHKLLVGMIALGPVSRAVVFGLTLDRERNMYPLTSCLDSLGGGAALAYLAEYGALSRAGWYLRRAAIVAIPLLCASYLVPKGGVLEGGHLFLRDFLATLVASAIIASAATREGIRNIAGKFLEFRPVRYIGRISYGIYLYHFYLKFLVPQLIDRAGFHGLSPWPEAVLVCLAAFVTSSLSWHLVESPLNGLKRYFGYETRAQPEDDCHSNDLPGDVIAAASGSDLQVKSA